MAHPEVVAGNLTYCLRNLSLIAESRELLPQLPSDAEFIYASATKQIEWATELVCESDQRWTSTQTVQEAESSWRRLLAKLVGHTLHKEVDLDTFHALRHPGPHPPKI